MKETIEKHQLKITIGVAVVVLLFIIGATVQFSSWKANMEQDITLLEKGMEHHARAYTEHDTRLDVLEGENTDIQVRLAMIETKLTTIETILIEIKEDLKNR